MNQHPINITGTDAPVLSWAHEHEIEPSALAGDIEPSGETECENCGAVVEVKR